MRFAVLIILCFLFALCNANNNRAVGDDKAERLVVEQKKNKHINGIEKLKQGFINKQEAFSHMLSRMVPFSSPSTFSSSEAAASATVNCWDRVKNLIKIRFQAQFSPPNLEGSDEMKEKMKAAGGEKVKEAMTQSLEKTKATVEDTAKSAANIATQTLHKTKEKLKRSFSGSDSDTPEEHGPDEL